MALYQYLVIVSFKLFHYSLNRTKFLISTSCGKEMEIYKSVTQKERQRGGKGWTEKEGRWRGRRREG